MAKPGEAAGPCVDYCSLAVVLVLVLVLVIGICGAYAERLGMMFDGRQGINSWSWGAAVEKTGSMQSA